MLFAKNYIINISGAHLGQTFPENEWDKRISGLDLLDDFITTQNSVLLYACASNDENLTFLREVPNFNEKPTPTMVIIFSKNTPCVLEQSNILHNIQVTSVSQPPTLALYNSINNVFAPILQKNEEFPALSKQVLSLGADLRSILTLNKQPNNLSLIRTLEHEVDFWSESALIAKGGVSKSASASFRDILTLLAKDFALLDACLVEEVEDVLENAYNVLDDLWRNKPPYPKDRMKNLINIIATHICQYSYSQIKATQIWSNDYKKVVELLQQLIGLGKRWQNSCEQLTKIFWPNCVENIWDEPSYVSEELDQFIKRLEQILGIRILYKQVISLLTHDEQNELKEEVMFAPFSKLETYPSDAKNTEVNWLKATKLFERLLEPAEQKVAFKLQKQLSSVNADVRQLLYEFTRYSELINRPILRQALQTERQFLLTCLFDYVQRLQSQTSSDNLGASKFNTPQIVKDLMVTRQLETRCKDIKTTSDRLLNDLQGFENLNNLLFELMVVLKKQHSELFDAWTSDVLTKINSHELSLKESDPVVEFSKNKLMKVNYPPRLVLLINEVRQLRALGYEIPLKIDETSEHAKKFMYFAKILDQVANFHNTIGNRMIVSQRPMMLSAALNLSKLVQEQEVVSWGDTKSVEKYVDTLKNAVEDLSTQNNLLTMYHQQVIDKIDSLRDVDLLKDFSKWKDAIKFVKGIISEVEEKGFQNTSNWVANVVDTFSTILENQYLNSLSSLHQYLPEIFADLVYRNAELQFFPSESDLRTKYNQQLQKYLDIPKWFIGISENDANIFRNMIDKANLEMEKVDQHREELFSQLQAVIKHWTAWLQIGDLDVSKLSTWQHWDLHFKVSKTFGQEIAKLPSTEERIGCFIIGLTRLRSDLESHNRSYWDQLSSSLKDSIAQDVFTLQSYVDSSTTVLTKSPVTLEEIAESGAAHANINNQRDEMEKTFDETLRKASTLASWTREQVDSVNRLKGAWERLQSLLENHQHIIAKQMETIKTTLNIEADNVNKEMERFFAKWEQAKPKPGFISDSSLEELSTQFKIIKDKEEQWKVVLERKQTLKSDYAKYSITVPEESGLEDKIAKDIYEELKSWEMFERFYSDFALYANEEWIVFRKKLYTLDDFLADWNTKLKNEEQNDLVVKITQQIYEYETVLPSLKFVKGDDFTEKHWTEIFTLLNMPPKSIEALTVHDFLSVSDKILQNSKELQKMCKKAASEIVVRQALSELDQWDIQSRFVLTPHNDSQKRTIMVIKDFKDILSKIGDNQSLLQSVKNSSDFDSFSERASLWDAKLIDLDYFLTNILQVQKKWVYLEPIFVSGTLVQEKTRFDKINRDFQYLMKFIENDTKVTALCRFPNLRSLLDNLLDQLSRCQNSLDAFLSEKRNKFPRFLFLGDDDLLEVVGQSSKELVIQTHLKKLFAGINTIVLDNGSANIVSICSQEGEVVQLQNPVKIHRPVEEWLNGLVEEMQGSLKKLLTKCLAEHQNADPWLYPSQILCLADQINFTTSCEHAISTMSLPALLGKYQAQLSHFNSLDLQGSGDKNSSAKTENVFELKLKALLLDTIHHISVLDELLGANVSKTSDWEWKKQLRFYSDATGHVVVKMANATIDYAFEYLGNCPKLVRTHLTDQCFLTLTQGMHLGMGGNPYGPAGTGKTETVKALGSLLGRQVLVFNCDEGIDASSMGRILSGLVQSGAWGCFDEFNRLDEATLSAISMQIQPIQNALRAKSSVVKLLDKDIILNRHCGVFVTMNPAGGSYGGRNKLPDNLKQLFRPVVMTQPDNEDIAKSLLMCDGFKHADIISRKIIEVFAMAAKLLSKERHYDWGLRAIRTILAGCSDFKPDKTSNLASELEIVVKTLRLNTYSKLSTQDAAKFDTILKVVFQSAVETKSYENTTLVKALEEACAEEGLKSQGKQVAKCLDLYEQLRQRMGVAIVGQASSGKTSVRNLLFTALKKMGRNVKQVVFNPKSMSRRDLLGFVDSETRQWTDGVLTSLSLRISNESSEIWSWIVCDGDVDPEWVESLNSVLDDNRILTLPSGCRIRFGPNVNFIFETHSLGNASPATISRMGIVLLGDEVVNLDSFVSLELQKLDSSIGPLVEEYLIKCIDWITQNGEVALPCSKVAMLKLFLNQAQNVSTKNHLCVLLVNSLGQLLQYDFREPFAQQVYEWLSETPPPSILRSCYNQDRDAIEMYFTNPSTQIDDISTGIPVVLTGQINQTLDLVKVCLVPNEEKHFLLVGQHGCAKTLLLQNLVQTRSDIEVYTFNCCSGLEPSVVKTKLAQLCISVNTNKGKMYKPKKGHLVLHFRNMHLLKADKWGTNIMIQFLHQIMTFGAFFDFNLELVQLEKVTIVGALEGTNLVPERFTSLMNIFNIDPPTTEDLVTILVAYLAAIMSKIGLNMPKAKVTKLVTCTLAIFEQIKSLVGKAPQNVFTPHDLVAIFTNIQNYNNLSEENINTIVAFEIIKIFGDRTSSDLDKLQQIIASNFSKTFSASNVIPEGYFAPLAESRQQSKLTKLKNEEWVLMMQKGITQYEREGASFEGLIISDDLLKLTESVVKVLSIPEGNVFLIGRSGVGRQSSIKIASSLLGARLLIPTSNLKGSFNSFLKQAIQMIIIDDQPIYLFLEDHILINESILTQINTLITSGELPGLYSTTELDALLLGLTEDANRNNFEGDLITYFAKRIKKYLHVIASANVENAKIGEIFQNFPCFTQNFNIIQKVELSPKTIQNLPYLIINRYNASEENKIKIPTNPHFEEAFSVCKTKSQGPSKYILLINEYIRLFDKKMLEITTKQTKLTGGVTKLNDAKNLVVELKQKAAIQRQKLEEKQSKANSALDMISNTMRNANTHRKEMQSLKSKTEEENQILLRRKREIEEELSEVEPLIKEARSAVGNIKTEALSEIRSLRAPPEIIRDILEGVLRLMGIQDTSWNSMKTFLSKRGVKEDIRAFDATRITPENKHAVERLMSLKKDSFDPKSAKRASIAAAPLVSWVVANVKYASVLEKIKPLEREQNKLKQNLSSAENQLGELSAGLLDVDQTVLQLKNQLASYTKEAAEIEIDLQKAELTLSSAEDLVDKLNDEFQRWQVQLKELSSDVDALSNNCLLAAIFITTLGPESEEQRNEFLAKCVSHFSEGKTFDFVAFLSSERERLQWEAEGLQNDKLSVENAIIILKSNVTPLLLDPTLNALSWIKNRYKGRNVESTNQNSPKFATILELAVRFGKVLIVEDVEHVSPELFPILRKQFTYQGVRKLILLNGKQVDYHNDFRIILATRNETFRLQGDISSKIELINFTITTSGLAEQLISSAIKQENPHLEKQKKELLSQKEQLQEKQFSLQNQLLDDLANSTGDILQNTSLLNSLNETKASSISISKAIKESVKVQHKLQGEINIYRNLSTFASDLYFAANEFSKYNTMYSISVAAFVRIFLKALSTFQNLENSLESQKTHLLNSVYAFMSRGVFKNDRVKFLLHLVHKMYPDKIPEKEWALFLGKVVDQKLDEGIPNWVPKKSEQRLQNIQAYLPDMFSCLKLNEATLWREFLTAQSCDQFPSHCKHLSDFQKILLVQALRSDRLYSAITQFHNMETPVLDLGQIYKESVSGEPILLLTVFGSDPSSEISTLGISLKVDIMEFAMGEGQESKAIIGLDEAAKNGCWVVLKNLHLVTNWLGVLWQKLQSLEAHPSFRVWLVTEAHDNFNVVLAQNSLKVVYEAPRGLKNNLTRIYNTFGSKFVDSLNSNAARIFFTLSCVHALLQERRNYIPQGWSKYYEFSDIDLSTCVKLVAEVWQTQSMQIPWSFIQGICLAAVYGSRIETKDDKTVLESYLRQYLSDDVLSHRWKPFGLNISMPNPAKYQEIIKTLQAFPNKETPVLFGLPENIDGAWQRQMSTEIIQDLKNLHLAKSSTTFNASVWIKGLTPIMSYWRKLNQGHDFIRIDPPRAQTTDSNIATFVTEEFTNGVLLVQKIHKCFSALNRCSKELLNPSEEELRLGNSLLNGKTPQTWLLTWSGPVEIVKFLKAILAKMVHLSKWISNLPNVLQNPVNLSHLFNPDAFLASFMLDFAKKSGKALDDLVLDVSWRNQGSNGLVLTNIGIEGAFFDGRKLEECKSHAENVAVVPDCYVSWTERRNLGDEDFAQFPVYLSPNRQNKLFSIKIQSLGTEKDKWIQAGVAFFIDY